MSIGSLADARTQPGKSKTVADILTAAADLIVGPGAWTQRTYGVAQEGKYSCLCLYGAICEAAHCGGDTDQRSYRLEDGAYYAVRKLVGQNPIDWNDAPERTQAEVVAALRQAAEKACQAVSIMIDARYEEAQRSNQSCDRGWDLFPEPPVSEFRRPSFLVVILSVVSIAAALIGAITQ